jgi:uncharacterized membrane protein YedE/YeeE
VAERVREAYPLEDAVGERHVVAQVLDQVDQQRLARCRVGEEIKSSMHNFTPVASLAGGVLIGLASVWLLAANGRIAGVSGILHGLVAALRASPPGDRLWRVLFVGGLIVAGFAWHAFSAEAPTRDGFGLGWATAAGLLVGFGTRIGGGCTSGHGVCGLGRLSLRSLVAVAIFMATGMAAAFVTRHLLGVSS